MCRVSPWVKRVNTGGLHTQVFRAYAVLKTGPQPVVRMDYLRLYFTNYHAAEYGKNKEAVNMIKNLVRKIGAKVALAAGMVAVAVPAMAFTPVVGDVGYVIYDLANKMSTGAVGATVGLGGVVWGATMLFKGQYLPAVGTILAAVAVANSASLLNTMGLVI